MFSCVVLASAWFVIEMGVTLHYQQVQAAARKARDEELKRQRAEEARLRFEAAQLEIQRQTEGEEAAVELDDDAGGAKIPLESLMKKGVAAAAPPTEVTEEGPPNTVGGMSALDFDMALMRMDAESTVRALRRA